MIAGFRDVGTIAAGIPRSISADWANTVPSGRSTRTNMRWSEVRSLESAAICTAVGGGKASISSASTSNSFMLTADLLFGRQMRDHPPIHQQAPKPASSKAKAITANQTVRRAARDIRKWRNRWANGTAAVTADVPAHNPPHGRYG